MTELLGLPNLLAEDLASTTTASPTEPQVGELWMLSWDRAFLGIACIAEVMEDHVLAWPVTLPDEPAFAPALYVGETPLHHGLYMWPTRETGLGKHLLDRPLGRLVPADLVDSIAMGARRGETTRYPYAAGFCFDDENQTADEAMVVRWVGLCFHVWPPEDRDLYISDAKIKSMGITPQQVAEAMGLDAASLRDIWWGEQSITADQARAIADYLQVDVDALLGEDPFRDVLERLASPVYKADLVARSREFGILEGEMRELVRSDFALAARDDSSSLTDAKLHDAIKRARPPQAE